MGDFSNFVGSVVETIAKYNRATTKSYQNIRHVMTEECEILVPNETEEYVFRLQEGWKIISQDKGYLTVKREINDRKEKIQIE